MQKIEIRIERWNEYGTLDVHIIGYDDMTGTYFYSKLAEGMPDIFTGRGRRLSSRWMIGRDKIRCIICALLSGVPDTGSATVDDWLNIEVKAVQGGDGGIERTGTVFHDETGKLKIAVKIPGTDHIYETMAIGYGDVKCFLRAVFTAGRIPRLSGGFSPCPDLCRPGCQGLSFLPKTKAPS